MRPALVLLAIVLVPGLSVAACSGGDDAAAPPTATAGRCHRAEGGQVTIVAKDLAWDTACLEVPAGQPVTVVVDNQDSGVAHNLHLKTAPGNPTTALEVGPIQQHLTVTLPAGTYPYICDVHPNMEGAIQAT
jgi:plastocyanin